MVDLEIKDIGQVHAGARRLAELSGALSRECYPPEPYFGNDDYGAIMRSNYPSEWVAEINKARGELGEAVVATGTNISQAAAQISAQDAEDAEGFSRIGDGGGGGGGQSVEGSSVVPAATPAGPPPPAGPGPAPTEVDHDLEYRSAHHNARAVDQDIPTAEDHGYFIRRATNISDQDPAEDHGYFIRRATNISDQDIPTAEDHGYAIAKDSFYGSPAEPSPDSSAGAPGMGSVPPPRVSAEAHFVPAPELANDSGYYISPLPPSDATLFPEISYGDSVAPAPVSSPEAAGPQYGSPPERQSAELTTMPGQVADQGPECGPDDREWHSASLTGTISRADHDELDLYGKEHSPDRDNIKWKSRYSLL